MKKGNTKEQGCSAINYSLIAELQAGPIATWLGKEAETLDQPLPQDTIILQNTDTRYRAVP